MTDDTDKMWECMEGGIWGAKSRRALQAILRIGVSL